VMPGEGEVYCSSQPEPGTGCTFDVGELCWSC
jgi:hypothetical protein